MIRFLKGIFHPTVDGSAIIETEAGIGFRISMPSNSQLYKSADGDVVSVYTSMQVKEDAVNLYGFTSVSELELFELLITVNGVGAKAGLSIMSALSSDRLNAAISAGDTASITKANGVGKKTAERIILELKDKVAQPFDEGGIQGADDSHEPETTSEKEEAAAALISLGYTRNEAMTAIGKVKGDSLTCEEYIRGALRNL